MSRRIEIELTSARPDGTWTWRAAGAREPKGVLEGGLLYEGATVGDVLRADAEFEIDGITVTSVLAPPPKRVEAGRLEVIGGPEPAPQSYADMEESRGSRPPRRGDDRRERRPGRDGPGRARPPRAERPPRVERAPGERPQREPREPRAPRAERPTGERPQRQPREPRPPRPERPKRPERPEVERPKAKRLQPGRAHRDAVLASLPDEHRPIAEQVLRGGVPVVRKAIEEENAKALADGRPEVKADALVALAEDLLPRLRAAEWLDRAEAAAADADAISLRDLRSVVISSDAAARQDEGRVLAAQLREALARRSQQERQQWLDEITRSLDESRVVRALRVSSRPPEPGTRFPAELVKRLSEAAGTAMNAEATVDRWVALLDAVAASAVRRTVQPAGLPAEPSEELLAAARRAATRVPGIAKLLGIEPEEGSTPPPREKPSGSRRRDRRPPSPRAGPPPTPRPESPVDNAAEHRQPTPPVSELSAGIAAWILDGETEETG